MNRAFTIAVAAVALAVAAGSPAARAQAPADAPPPRRGMMEMMDMMTRMSRMMAACEAMMEERAKPPAALERPADPRRGPGRGD